MRRNQLLLESSGNAFIKPTELYVWRIRICFGLRSIGL